MLHPSFRNSQGKLPGAADWGGRGTGMVVTLLEYRVFCPDFTPPGQDEYSPTSWVFAASL